MNTNSSQETKSKIIYSAIRYFSLYGKQGTTIAQIARGAGVNKSSVFYHFDNKDTLYDIVLRSNLEHMINHLHYELFTRHVKTQDSRKLIEVLTGYWQWHPNTIRLIAIEIHHGATRLPEMIKGNNSENIRDKVYNILNILEHHISFESDDAEQVLQKFISFIGIILVYFLLEPLLTQLLALDTEVRERFLRERVNFIEDIYQRYREFFDDAAVASNLSQ